MIWSLSRRTGDSRSRIPPFTFFEGFGRSCFLRKFTRSTMAVPLIGFTRRTLPCLPRSLPVSTTTVSPFFTCDLPWCSGLNFVAFPYMSLDDLRRERNDLHELALAQFAGDGTEDARPDRLALIVDENSGVVVELDVGTIFAAMLLHGSHDDRFDDRTFLHGAVR